MPTISAHNTFADWNDQTLTIGNSCFTRSIDLSLGYPRTVKLLAHNLDFATPDKMDADCSFFGIYHPRMNDTRWTLTEPVSATFIEAPDFDSPHLLVTIRFKELGQNACFTRRLRIYPDLPACSSENELTCAVTPICYHTYRSNLSNEGNFSRYPEALMESAVDSFKLTPQVKLTRAVEFMGRTDYHNTTVINHDLDGQPGCFNGNLLFGETDDHHAMVLVQEAPPSTERRDFEKHDFRLSLEHDLSSCCWGVPPEDLTPGATVKSYRHAVILCSPQQRPTDILKDYLKTRFPMKNEEARVVVNPWGCGHFPQYTSEQFLLEEIKAAGEINAEVYQIDDSWQNGKTLAELSKNKELADDFWNIDTTRLPQGFTPLQKQAETAGINLGLWCAPTSNKLYRDWDAFADKIIDYHNKYGFVTVKVDGVMTPTAEAEQNLERLLKKIRTVTDKRVFFNLDTTNGQRPGYFMFLEYGSIFLSNRYNHVSPCIPNGYHPQKTLANLWDLSHYLRPQTLQIELPVPDDIPEDATFNPTQRLYPFDYWCAIPLLANVLVWTAPSRISQQTRDTLKEMITLHRSIRTEIFDATISPIYDRPDGQSITGFETSNGYQLIFRELNCTQETVTMPTATGHIVAGHGTLNGNQLTLPAASYCLWKA